MPINEPNSVLSFCLSLKSSKFNVCARFKVLFPASPWSFSYSLSCMFILKCYPQYFIHTVFPSLLKCSNVCIMNLNFYVHQYLLVYKRIHSGTGLQFVTYFVSLTPSPPHTLHTISISHYCILALT